MTVAAPPGAGQDPAYRPACGPFSRPAPSLRLNLDQRHIDRLLDRAGAGPFLLLEGGDGVVRVRADLAEGGDGPEAERLVARPEGPHHVGHSGLADLAQRLGGALLDFLLGE